MNSPRPGPLLLFVVLAIVFGVGSGSRARAEPSPAELSPVVGRLEGHLVEPGQTLHDVAYLHRVGFEAVERLNPDLDPWIPGPGTVVWLPTRYVLPSIERHGLVINVPEMRLYDWTRNAASNDPDPTPTTPSVSNHDDRADDARDVQLRSAKTFGTEPARVYAVAVGDHEDPTPLGEFRIGSKLIDPVWYVPDSIQSEKPDLPDAVPHGPENPLGSRWMTIGRTSYGLHGTNVRWSIGRESTHGCVRLYEDDIMSLFDRIEEGTSLRLVYQPYKWGRIGSALYLEAHPDLYGRIPNPISAAMEIARSLGFASLVDRDRVARVIERARGVPVHMGSLP